MSKPMVHLRCVGVTGMGKSAIFTMVNIRDIKRTCKMSYNEVKTYVATIAPIAGVILEQNNIMFIGSNRKVMVG